MMAATLARQRALLDRLLRAGLLPLARYLAARAQIADEAPLCCCVHHPRRPAHIYAPDDVTPLCGECAVVAYGVQEES